MANRIPRFESHIRPMIRRLDRDAMVAARNFDLWSYDDVRNKADRILKRLTKGVAGASGAMPPPTAGGPWPEEWVALFERWIALGFPRLELASGAYTVTRVSAGILTLTAAGANPAPGFETWLEPVLEPTEPLHFVLYREPPGAPGAGSPSFSAAIDFGDTAIRTLLVVDANGQQRVDFAGV